MDNTLKMLNAFDVKFASTVKMLKPKKIVTFFKIRMVNVKHEWFISGINYTHINELQNLICNFEILYNYWWDIEFFIYLLYPQIKKSKSKNDLSNVYQRDDISLQKRV